MTKFVISERFLWRKEVLESMGNAFQETYKRSSIISKVSKILRRNEALIPRLTLVFFHGDMTGFERRRDDVGLLGFGPSSASLTSLNYKQESGKMDNRGGGVGLGRYRNLQDQQVFWMIC